MLTNVNSSVLNTRPYKTAHDLSVIQFKNNFIHYLFEFSFSIEVRIKRKSKSNFASNGLLTNNVFMRYIIKFNQLQMWIYLLFTV